MHSCSGYPHSPSFVYHTGMCAGAHNAHTQTAEEMSLTLCYIIAIGGTEAQQAATDQIKIYATEARGKNLQCI